MTWTAWTPTVFCAVTAVTAEVPKTPRAAKVLRSACRPAPAPESDPAMVRATGGDRAWPGPDTLTLHPGGQGGRPGGRCPSPGRRSSDAALSALAEVGHPGPRRGGLGMPAVRDPAREARQPAGPDGASHGPGHGHRILGPRDGRGHQDGVAAQLHGQGCIRGGAYARIEHHGHPGLLHDQGNVVGVADPQAAPDGGPEGHDGSATRLLQPPGHDRVVVGVGKDLEAVVHQLLSRVHQLDRVGQEGALVAYYLQLDPVRGQGLSCQLRSEDRVACGEATCCVGKHPDPEAAQDVQYRSSGQGVDPAEGDSGQGRPRGLEGKVELVQAGHSARPHDQAGAQEPARDLERILDLDLHLGLRRRGPGCGGLQAGHGHPPWAAVSISMRSWAARVVVDHWLRGTTVSFSATAMPLSLPESLSTTAAMVVPGAMESGSPFTTTSRAALLTAAPGPAGTAPNPRAPARTGPARRGR